MGMKGSVLHPHFQGCYSLIPQLTERSAHGLQVSVSSTVCLPCFSVPFFSGSNDQFITESAVVCIHHYIKSNSQSMSCACRVILILIFLQDPSPSWASRAKSTGEAFFLVDFTDNTLVHRRQIFWVGDEKHLLLLSLNTVYSLTKLPKTVCALP